MQYEKQKIDINQHVSEKPKKPGTRRTPFYRNDRAKSKASQLPVNSARARYLNN
jgi:hypothetical protein